MSATEATSTSSSTSSSSEASIPVTVVRCPMCMRDGVTCEVVCDDCERAEASGHRKGFEDGLAVGYLVGLLVGTVALFIAIRRPY